MNGIPNAYAGEPPALAVNPDDATYKAQLHEQAAVLVERAHVAQQNALDLLNEAARILDNADRVDGGDTGLDSIYARAQVANMADKLEALSLDDLADEVRTCRR